MAEKTEQADGASRPLKLHHLRPAPGAHKPKTRVGRGEGSKGKTAGRGTKGTKARSTVPVGFEGGQMPIHMRLPKLKGFKNRNRIEFQVVNLTRLAELFPQGGEVGPEELAALGAVRAFHLVKILGDGDLGGVKLTVTAHAFSKSAREKIEAAGGTATTL
ncbi:MAG: 50S ribosomal protein L15 [Corynebacteriales bacterium]|nr:50S ribosomal protein L15 [Mycobacteriales bacterium]